MPYRSQPGAQAAGTTCNRDSLGLGRRKPGHPHEAGSLLSMLSGHSTLREVRDTHASEFSDPIRPDFLSPTACSASHATYMVVEVRNTRGIPRQRVCRKWRSSRSFRGPPSLPAPLAPDNGRPDLRRRTVFGPPPEPGAPRTPHWCGAVRTAREVRRVAERRRRETVSQRDRRSVFRLPLRGSLRTS